MGKFNTLPLEIMLEILSRVPAEYIVDCKCVSKPWRNLVQHPSFSQLHFNHLNSLGSDHESGKSGFIFYTYENSNGSDQFHYTEFDENSNGSSKTTRIDLRLTEDCYIVGAFNGLICFNKCGTHGPPAYICNPITREYIILPEVEGDDMFAGFGYSPSTNEYKVVRICTIRKVSDFKTVQVYTLGSGIGWRKVRNIDPDMINRWQQGSSADGAIHWLDNIKRVIAFDLADEEFYKLPPLPFLPRDGCNSSSELFVLGDSLCAYYHHCNEIGSWELWSLKKNKNYQDVVWSKVFSNFNVARVGPLTFTKSGGLLWYDYLGKNVMLQHLEASSASILVSFGEEIYPEIPHKNTLVSLKALGEEDTKQMDSGERARSSKETESND